MERKRSGTNYTLILAKKWLNAFVSCCLMEANGIYEILLYLEIPLDFHHPLSY